MLVAQPPTICRQVKTLPSTEKVRHLIWNDSRVATEYNILTVGKST